MPAMQALFFEDNMKKTDKIKFNPELIIGVIAIIASYFFGVAKMGMSDINRLSLFSLIFLLIGILVSPLGIKRMQGFFDGGLIAIKTFGLCLFGFFMWLLSSIHILPYNRISSIIVTLLTGIACWLPLIIKENKRKEYISVLKENIQTMFLTESLFYSMFVLVTWYMCHKIPGHDTERIMNLAFMTSLDNTAYMPPLDMWASGHYINYYYFGHYLITFLGKLCFCKVQYSYTLGLYLIVCVMFWGIYTLVRTITKDSFEGSRKKIYSMIAAVISAISTTFAGNMHFLVFYKLVPAIRDILKIDEDYAEYYFSNSTRYIGYVPERTGDKTISEFPIYSFYIGDLHAHVIDVLCVITILSVLYAYVRNRKNDKNDQSLKNILLSELSNPYVIAIGFLLGICSMANMWDFPIYFVVCGSVILFNNLRLFDDTKKSILVTLLQGVYVLVIRTLVALPFTIKFDAMVNGIGVVTSRSYIHQLIILWGYPVMLVITYLFVVMTKKKLNIYEMFVALIGMCAIGLVLIPELVYVKDIYESGFPRANTMFKVSYQAFILFGIVTGIIIVRLLAYRVNGVTTRVGIIGVLCFLSCFGYFFVAGRQWLGDIKNDSTYICMDARWKLDYENTALLDSISFLQQYVELNEDHTPVVLEAYGSSFSDDCPVSLYTGYPTVLGWQTHEWLWQNTYDFVRERSDDVFDIYTSQDYDYVRSLLEKYNVEYIYIGREEYERFGEVQFDVLEKMGHVIYCMENMEGQLVEIIKVD